MEGLKKHAQMGATSDEALSPVLDNFAGPHQFEFRFLDTENTGEFMLISTWFDG